MPYMSHEPKLGRESRSSPVFISRIDCSWLGVLQYIERMTQMSSACWAVLAKISLNSRPLWPYWSNRNGERQRRPGRPFGAQVARRQLLAVVFREQRLRIERVDLRRTAVE